MKPILILLAWVLLGALAGYGIYLLFLQPAPVPPLPANVTNQTENVPPANETDSSISVTFIEAPGCEQCNSEGYVFEQARVILIQRSEVPVDSERTLSFSDPEAAELISKYNIPALPAVVMEGPVSDYPDLVSHWQQTLGIETEGALLSAPFPPYYIIASGETIGILEAVAIEPDDCPRCSQGGSFIASLQGLPANMVFSETTIYHESDPEAAALIEQHNITRLPALLLSEGVEAYPIYPDLSVLGDASDGWFVLRDTPPPFLDLQDNTTKGLVKSIYLMDQSCTECFDIRSFASYLSQSAGLVVEQETYFDVRTESGEDLAKKYNVTRIPTLLFSPDANYYPGFKEFWVSQGNTVEEDGWYVFRTHDLFVNLTYKNFTG